ncbi:DUF3658 domain-containing protein [Nocardia panacis]|uniref:DUF3658 domain-containing protein n=1 Tax=Nocardia panacis TaxID=2340916 RepID=UPI003F7027CC
MSKHSAQEYADYLFLTTRPRDHRLHVIDVTAGSRGPANESIAAVASLTPAEISTYLGSERALDGAERTELAQKWARLRSENAPLRVVSAASELVSAPVDYFDEALQNHVSVAPTPMPAVIAAVMAEHRFQTGDYVLQRRLIDLVAAGVVAAEGDPRTARSCRIRQAEQ